jgi:hypothetical protein
VPPRWPTSTNLASRLGAFLEGSRPRPADQRADHFWQFRSKKRSFGSRSFDYVKAFALGVAVEAAMANLPEALDKLVLT